MNVLIFGAAGGIGRHAVKHALAKGYQVTAYLRDKNKIYRIKSCELWREKFQTTLLY